MTSIERRPALLQLGETPGKAQRILARGQNFVVEHMIDDGTGHFGFASATESILLLPTAAVRLSGDLTADLPRRSIVIVPAGAYEMRLVEAGDLYLLSTDRLDIDDRQELNADMYADPDPRVRPVGPPFKRAGTSEDIRIYPVEQIPIPPDNGRLRFLQSETMSLNWVEYSGTRGRDALSPHAHDDFEQASLAIEGDFVHHLRTPWGRNADLWREDEHVPAGAGSITIIPPHIIHTTEGVGDGLHILVDIFAPPRRDFIAKNWIFNARDYADPMEAA
ncbi:MAG TPA: hypothetical protein VNZ43_09110 [Sphingomonadaceae bacterium]|nr:hypothetical protein [Sphingomonadaceae bacterium]